MKLTTSLLRKIIAEESAKFKKTETTVDRAKETEELDADEVGSEKALVKKVDYIKALKIEENRLRKRLAKIVETRQKVLKSL